MSSIERTEDENWIYYSRYDKEELDDHKCGKWMYFFDDFKIADRLCKRAVKNDICTSAKHSNKEDDGVCCFYLNIDDIERHKKVLSFFLENDLIDRTKDGRLQNVPFKLDEQINKLLYIDLFLLILLL